MIKNPSILIIIPVYNEQEKIRSVVGELLAHSYNQIVLVDDGSNQDIQGEVSDLPVTYLKHCVNLGQGAALQTGFNYAREINCDVIVTFDADGQHDCNDIAALIRPIINDEADIVFGSRFLTAERSNIPPVRKFMLKCARLVNYLFSGILLTDAHNGLRAFNTKTLNSLQITENRMAHATQILYDIKKHHLRYQEVSVNVRYTSYSKQKGQADWNSVRIFSDLVLHKLFRSSK